MDRTIVGFLVAASMCVPPSGTAAQDPPSPMYLVRQEFVRPAETSRYEEQTARWIERLLEARPAEPVQWVAVVGPELGYSYVVPIDGFAGIDLLREHLSTSRSDVAGRWREDGSEAIPIERVRASVISLRPDLSYLPRAVELDLTLPFRKYHWYHVTPGLERRFEDAARRLVALYAEQGIEHGFRFYEFELGHDLPIFLLVERAADAADYAARTERVLETVGADADALFGEMLRSTRSLRIMEGMTDGELSFPPLGDAPSATLGAAEGDR